MPKFRIEMLDGGGWRPTLDPLFDNREEAEEEIARAERSGHVTRKRRVVEVTA